MKCTYGYVFKVVSNSHSVDHVTASLLHFIQHEMRVIIDALMVDTTHQLMSHVQALLAKYRLPSVDLHDEAKYHWDEIKTERCEFQFYTKKAEYLEARVVGDAQGQRELVEDMRSFWNSYFMSEASVRRLTVSAGHPMKES
jgi:hypothetical protein